MEGAGDVLRVTVGEPGLVPAREDSQQLETVTSSPDGEVVTTQGRLKNVENKIYQAKYGITYINCQIKKDLSHLSIAPWTNQRSRAARQQQPIDVFEELKYK